MKTLAVSLLIVGDLLPLKETYLADPDGRSRTLVLRIHEPDNEQPYEPRPLYDVAPER